MFKRISYGSMSLCFGLSVLLLSGCGGGGGGGGSSAPASGTTKAQLGRKIFFDENLSSEQDQSCATCHDPVAAFADPAVTKAAPVSPGSAGTNTTFGDRNAPTAAYASFTPAFSTLVAASVSQSGETDSKYRGGQFLDGRASTLEDQAKGPFTNPAEMNLPDAAAVVAVVENASYAGDFRTHYGAGAFDNVTTAFNNIADAIATFERSSELNPFTSKYDAYLAGSYTLTAAEARGLALFKDANPGGAKCANCHTLDDTVGSDPSDSLFTNFEYYNIGSPVNAGTPTSVADDLGLGGSGATGEVGEQGKFRVPTLRNVELTAPYMHNGVFETLEEVIRHYDLFGSGNLPDPEVGGTDREVADPLIADELEDPNNLLGLGLDVTPINPPTVQSNDYTDLEAFMMTLTDGYM